MQDNQLQQIIKIFNINRMKILLAISGCNKNICGCDLVDQLDIAKNLLSYHMSSLEKQGLIQESRCGQKKNYLLTKKGEKMIVQIYKINKILGIKHE